MPLRKKIHQIFFKFDKRQLEDFPVFMASHNAFKRMRGWRYCLWDEQAVERLCRTRYPQIWSTYRRLKYDIQRVDLAKYMIADAYGGVVADLDTLPRCHVDNIIGENPYLFDRCSRPNIIANDFFYIGGAGGLPGIFDYFTKNLARVNAIPVYQQRKMRYVFHTTGPDFFTRYLKLRGLRDYVQAISNRTFLDPKQRYRSVSTDNPQIDVIHHLSWASQLEHHADGLSSNDTSAS